jgi:hypothetical protein
MLRNAPYFVQRIDASALTQIVYSSGFVYTPISLTRKPAIGDTVEITVFSSFPATSAAVVGTTLRMATTALPGAPGIPSGPGALSWAINHMWGPFVTAPTNSSATAVAFTGSLTTTIACDTLDLGITGTGLAARALGDNSFVTVKYFSN